MNGDVRPLARSSADARGWRNLCPNPATSESAEARASRSSSMVRRVYD